MIRAENDITLVRVDDGAKGADGKMSAEQLAQLNQTSSDAAQAKSDISNIEIGGRNLFVGSEKAKLNKYRDVVTTRKIYPEKFYSPRHLRTEIKKYIEEYNSIRPHRTHGYNTPDDVYNDIFENEIKPDTTRAA